MILKLVLFSTVCALSFAAQVEELFAWKEIDYTWQSPEAKQEALKKGTYIPENNLPLGLERWKNKLFVTVPRWKAGTGASLNYVTLNPIDKLSPLTPYPDWKANTLPENGTTPADNQIISTFRVRVDACDRLWVIDTGLADILGEGRQISKPALVIFDLNTDKLVRRYTLKPTDLKDSSFFANLIVDAEPGKCEQAFAYIPDLGGYGLIVYSFATDDSWRIQHNYFHLDPLKGDLNIGGINFQWTDGVFGLALSNKNPDGYRTLYFHALASTKEFAVSTEILQNRTLATDSKNYHEFKLLGDKGENTQTSASDFDKKTGVLFLTQLQKDGVACWNTNKPLTPENVALIIDDKETMIFTNDIKVDSEQNLFFFSNKMPLFLYRKLDPTQVNFRIFKANTEEAIKGTPCAPY